MNQAACLDIIQLGYLDIHLDIILHTACVYVHFLVSLSVDMPEHMNFLFKGLQTIVRF